MNENTNDPSDEEILDAAFSTMRARSIPDGPSERQIALTVTALNAAALRKPNIFSRLNNMKFITGMAASILLFIGLLLVAIVMLRSPEISFGEIVQTVRSAHAMSFAVTTDPTPTTPQTRMKMLLNDHGQFRGEVSNGSRMVMDMKIGHMLITDPVSKVAIVMDMKNLPQKSNNPADVMESFKKLQNQSGKDLGKVELDGRKLEKFIATEDGADYIIWADPQTREPIRIDVTTSMTGQKFTIRMNDFQFNPEVSANAFDMNVPKGYSIQNYNVDLPDISNGEQNLIEVLRGYANRSGGKFPDKVEDVSQYMNVMAKHMEDHATTQPSNEDMQWFVRVQSVNHFLSTDIAGQWKYLGKGKTQGDSHAMIFWYKSSKPDHPGYRGIYADLSARDLPAAPQ